MAVDNAISTLAEIVCMAFILKMGTATDVIQSAVRVVLNRMSAKIVCLDFSRWRFTWAAA